MRRLAAVYIDRICPADIFQMQIGVVVVPRCRHVELLLEDHLGIIPAAHRHECRRDVDILLDIVAHAATGVFAFVVCHELGSVAGCAATPATAKPAVSKRDMYRYVELNMALSFIRKQRYKKLVRVQSFIIFLVILSFVSHAGTSLRKNPINTSRSYGTYENSGSAPPGGRI